MGRANLWKSPPFPSSPFSEQVFILCEANSILFLFLLGPMTCLFRHIFNCILSFAAMAPDSSTLAWKIPWMEEPGGLQSMGSQRVRHD